ncbi:ImmA/IrrE family metallo-endopeptidase [Azospirillum oryzae]|nr:ImmA/IrrE family metallo-endopeptidase [Azospirillum oryzae]GLR79723.1 transcriptional regulator [Azospirillum oryzae]
MPAGVDRFVPARLRMARNARALRQKDLAALVDRADTTVSKWESDDHEQRPDAVALSRLANALNIEVSWFFKPTGEAQGAAFFRSLKSELGRMRDKAEAKLSFVEEINSSISEYIDLPPVDIPDILDGRDFRTLRNADMDHYANALRDYWNIGHEPIEDLLLVIENAGIVTAHDEIGSNKLDGVSRWGLDERPYMLLARDKNVGARRRFDAAHELGHIVLHRHVTPDDLKSNFTLIEEQAMMFAGAFLLPEETFGSEVYSLSLEALCNLKPRWKVAIAAMIKRLSALDRITPEYERRLWQYYSYRRWRGCEPFDDELPVEQPQVLSNAIQMVLDENLCTRSDLIRQIGLPPADIANLTGVSEHYLAPPPQNLVRMKPAIRSRVQIGDTSNVVSIAAHRNKD